MTPLFAWINGIVDGLAGTITGMRLTATFALENWRGRGGGTAMTRQFPFEPARVPERHRGHLVNDVPRCITCSACLRACPVDCFTIVGERNEENKLRPAQFDIDLSKCIYCALCVRACPTDCLSMTPDFEVDPLRGYLFRQNSAQVALKLDTAEVALLASARTAAPAARTSEQRAALDRHQDPQGTHLVARYGVGYYTAAEKAQVEAERDRRKKEFEAQKAKAALIKAVTEGKAPRSALDAPVAGATPAASSTAAAPAPAPAAPPTSHLPPPTAPAP